MLADNLISAVPLVYLGACAGTLLVGVLMYGIIYRFTRSPLHLGVALLGSFGFAFVTGEMGVTLCHLANDPLLGRQLHRLQALATAFFIFGVPYVASGLTEFSQSWRAVNRVVSYASLAIVAAIALVAFATPDLFISQTAGGTESLHRLSHDAVRGRTGPVYRLRDIVLAALMAYALVLFVTDLLWHRNYRYITLPLAGSVAAILSGFLDYLYIYRGAEGPFPVRGSLSYFSVGITIMIVLCMVGIILKFIDQTRDIEKAQRIESLGVFAGGIAHDFNNLLAAIIGNISLAKLDTGAGGRAHRTLMEAEKAAFRARDLTQQLLTFSRGGEPVTRVTEVGAILAETAHLVLSGSNVRCDLRIDPALRNAPADPGQIGQVIQNIVINARQAMPDGGSVTITAANETGAGSGRSGEHYLRIAITDTGPGIDRRHLNRVFDPYFTTKSAGSGLGLAIAYSIVHKHRGRLTVRSKPGEGTTFEILLPATDEPMPATIINKRLPDRAGGGTVLIMDDEDLILTMAKAILEKLGYAAVTTTNGRDAVDAYRRSLSEAPGFCCVILDLTVPGGMGGKDVIATLRALDPYVKAIVSSGYSTDPVIAEFRAYGFAGVLTKPFGIDDMRRVLDTVLATEDGNP